MQNRPMFRTRLPLALLTATLLVGPGNGAFLTPAEGATGRSVEVRPLALLPGSPDLVIAVDYAALRRSDLVAGLEAQLDALPESAEGYRRFVRETGVDPRQDVDQFQMSMQGVGGKGEPAFLVIAQGRFSPSRLLDAAAEKGGSLATGEGGIRIWTSRTAPGTAGGLGDSGSVVALAQIDDSALLFGSESEVRRAVAIVKGGRKPETKDSRFRDLLAGTDRRAPFWAILNSASLARRVSSEIGDNSPGLDPGGALTAAESIRFMAWVGREVDLRVRMDAPDRESAGMLADVARGALAAGKLQAKDRDPELLRILQQVTVMEAGNGMELRALIPASRFRPRPAGDRNPESR